MPDIFDQLTARQKTAGQPRDSGIEPEGDAGADASAPLLVQGEQSLAQEEEYTPRELKKAVLELLKYGYLEAQRKANLYRTILTQRPAAISILEPLDFALKIDEVRGLAYLAIAGQVLDEDDEDEWNHPLVRRHRFTLEQSLLIAILRQQFAAYEQQAGVGAREALIPIEDLLPHLKLYFGDPGSDALEENRLRNMLDVLKGHGLVSSPPAAPGAHGLRLTATSGATGQRLGAHAVPQTQPKSRSKVTSIRRSRANAVQFRNAPIAQKFTN